MCHFTRDGLQNLPLFPRPSYFIGESIVWSTPCRIIAYRSNRLKVRSVSLFFFELNTLFSRQGREIQRRRRRSRSRVESDSQRVRFLHGEGRIGSDRLRFSVTFDDFWYLIDEDKLSLRVAQRLRPSDRLDTASTNRSARRSPSISGKSEITEIHGSIRRAIRERSGFFRGRKRKSSPASGRRSFHFVARTRDKIGSSPCTRCIRLPCNVKLARG